MRRRLAGGVISRVRRRRFAGVVAIAVTALLVTACDPGLVTSVAGNGTAGNSGDGGKATDASFEQPAGLAVLPDGSYDVVDQGACVIRRVSASGTISTIAGTGICGYSGDGGPATAAQINPAFDGSPASSGHLAVDATGNVYLADSGNGRIRRIATDGTITTVAGNGTTDLFTGCSGGAVLAGSLGFTPDGTLYVSCPNGVFKLMSDGSLQVVIADIVVSMTTDTAGDIYYADNNGVVIKRTPDGTVTTFTDVPRILQATAPLSGYQVGVSGLSVGPDGSVYAALGPTDLLVNTVDGSAPEMFSSNEVLRLGPGTTTLPGIGGPIQGTLTVIAGTNGPDPGTGTQSGYGPQLAITPYGIAATAENALLVSSGHNVYRLENANLAQQWSGTSCDPSKVKPGYDLSNQDLSGSNFYRCNLTGVNFSNTNLSGANLQQTILDNANLSGANLSDANLDGAHGVGIIGMPAALPVGWRVSAGILVPPSGDLSAMNLSGLDLHGADLHGTNLDGANLRGTDLSGADLAGATLIGDQMSNTNFSGADLSGANLSGPVTVTGEPTTANFTNANLSNLVTEPYVGGGPALYGSIFTGANVSGADLSNLGFFPPDNPPVPGTAVTSGGIQGTPKQLGAGVELINGFLVTRYANLTGANLHGIDLSGVDVSGVKLTGANLSHAKLTKANLSNVELSDANLTMDNLTGATLTSATVTNAQFSGATATSVVANALTGIPASLPLGVQFRTDTSATHGAFLYPGVNLSSANLDGVDLSGLDLTGANLQSASLENANLANANLTGGNLQAYLLNANLANATLTNANLTSATLSGADLTGADLSNANLTRAFLIGTNVAGTNFAGATAVAIIAFDLSGIPASLPLSVQFRTDTTVTHGAFFYVGANLVGSNLDGVDLSGLDLTVALLNNASLVNANLAGTNLTQANLSFATLTGATGTPVGAGTSIYKTTTCPDSTVVTSPATCVGNGF